MTLGKHMSRKRRSPVAPTASELGGYSIIEEVLRSVIDPIGPPAPDHFVRPPQFVYVTKADFGYKIGMTTRPESRPLQVSGKTPISLEVVALIEVDDMRKAEAQLHSYFAAKRLRGEWFALCEDDVALIRGYPKTFEQLPDPNDQDVPF